MRALVLNIEEYANSLLGLVIILILIGIIIEVILLTVGNLGNELEGADAVSPGSTREQRDSKEGEGGLGW